MENSSKFSKFLSKLDQLEQDLKNIYNRNQKELSGDSIAQEEAFTKELAKKIEKFLTEVEDQDKEAFREYIKQELGLKSDSDIKNFLSKAPNKAEEALSKTFTS
jgi:chemotaxis regulatin CheY-phosphate phosphatase CheZ